MLYRAFLFLLCGWTHITCDCLSRLEIGANDDDESGADVVVHTTAYLDIKTDFKTVTSGEVLTATGTRLLNLSIQAASLIVHAEQAKSDLALQKRSPAMMDLLNSTHDKAAEYWEDVLASIRDSRLFLNASLETAGEVELASKVVASLTAALEQGEEYVELLNFLCAHIWDVRTKRSWLQRLSNSAKKRSDHLALSFTKAFRTLADGFSPAQSSPRANTSELELLLTNIRQSASTTSDVLEKAGMTYLEALTLGAVSVSSTHSVIIAQLAPGLVVLSLLVVLIVIIWTSRPLLFTKNVLCVMIFLI